jgi:hypothetical protein
MTLNYESATKYCDLMKEAPMDVVMGAVLFFWTLGKELLMATLTSLENHKAGRLHPAESNSQTMGMVQHLPFPRSR